ncbi:GABA transporter 1-like [Gossypium australe]|uniref:GABA transporter 1-like n=1 Tax=Gossypium australe TaxID=47621 RepID=A0A5B6V6G7_9ROSI|nr:GABA transporter 1-like [Gossypium australe]
MVKNLPPMNHTPPSIMSQFNQEEIMSQERNLKRVIFPNTLTIKVFLHLPLIASFSSLESWMLIIPSTMSTSFSISSVSLLKLLCGESPCPVPRSGSRSGRHWNMSLV